MASHIQVQMAWLTAAELATYLGADREIIVNTSDRSLAIMDGTTPGGWKQASQAYVQQQLGAQVSSVAANLFLHGNCT